jgi:uncharacterized membrane protein YoaT (DUF817 family)
MNNELPSLTRKPMRLLQALLEFGYQQAMSCLFPVIILTALLISKTVQAPIIHNYDFILVVCLAAQYVLYKTGIETKDELKVIAVFHVIGTMLEIYKVYKGSWLYPMDGLVKVAGVPLYSGFMYASVASYMCQAWRRMEVRLEQWPRALWTVPLGAAIYLNFMTHHYIPDLRWWLSGLLVIVFFRTTVRFTVLGVIRRMPLLLSFALMGFFIWIAENIATLLGAWQYPNQRDGWSMVGLGKLSSWCLLVIISFMIVAQLKHVKAQKSD